MSLFLLFFILKAHSPPTAVVSDETERNPERGILWFLIPMIDYCSHSFSFQSLFLSVLFFLRDSVFENVPNGFCILGPCVNRHLTSSGDWGNLYHPTQFSVSFPLAVALWLTTYVYVPVAFLLKGQLQTVQTFFSFSFFFLLTFIRNNVTI